jgi:chromosomal replication initiator protein
MNDIWSQALQGLQPRLGSQTYDLWLRPIVFRGVEGDLLRLRAPSRFMKEWFEAHYLEAVLDEIRSRTSESYRVEIEIAATESEQEATPAAEIDTTESEPAVAAPPPAGLSERYRFSTFIKGASNELAATAAWSVAQEPGQRFNPLFIYGGVGLGKTHLLHAVGHALHESDPNRRIVYLTAERFMNEFISAVRYNQFDAFRVKYREDCDVLLLDDIQFIAGKDRTMDEFFHLFNTLYEAARQIIVTADRVPADMQGMEERLTSRLNWGLVADIKEPDLETRVAILRQKADEESIPISDELTVYIANLVRSNVRELEGALVRVSTFAALKGVPITESFIQDALGSVSRTVQPAPVTVEAVQKAVAQHFSVRISDLKGPRRHKGISRPRMVAMYLSRQLTGASFPEIGMRFGGKDHSTVINACRRIETIQSEDPGLRATLEMLRRQLVGTAGALPTT